MEPCPRFNVLLYVSGDSKEITKQKLHDLLVDWAEKFFEEVKIDKIVVRDF